MDPYLEQSWRDVHASLIIYARRALNLVLPPDLLARVEERVFIDTPEEDLPIEIYPDVRVEEHEAAIEPAAAPRIATAEPIVLPTAEPLSETYIEIVQAGHSGPLITVLEILSSSNKRPGAGRDLYLKKQRELVARHVNLVEIDLLRAGRHVLPIPLRQVPRKHRAPYRVSVRRARTPAQFELFPISLRQPLPTIRIPLREHDADAPLNLQGLLDEVYSDGRYGATDYHRDPVPALDPPNQSWANELLRAAGRR
jgi:hypothetical protein